MKRVRRVELVMGFTALLLAAGITGASVSSATDASQRGTAAAIWAQGAAAGNAIPVVTGEEDDEVAGDGAVLPDMVSKAHPQVAATARAEADAGVAALNSAQQSKFKVSLDAGSGRVKVLYGSQSKKYAGAPETVARGFLADARSLFGFREDLSDLKTARIDEALGKNHVRLQQTYNGVPIVGASILVHANKQGRVTMVQNGYVEGLRPANSALVADAAAKQAALDDLKGTADAGVPSSAGKSELQLVHRDGAFVYVWKISLPTQKPYGYWVYLIDAESGAILYKKNEVLSLKTGKGRAYTSNANYLANKASSVPLKYLVTPSESQLYSGYLVGAYAFVGTASGYDPFSYVYQYFYDPYSQPDQFHATQAYYAITMTRDWWLKNFVNKYYPGVNSYYNPFTWSTPVIVNYPNMCNAFYTPDIGNGNPGMVFGNEGSCSYGSADLVLDWDVVRHEYTHAMMDWSGFSGQFGGNVDWYGRAMGEGNADWYGYLSHPQDTRMAMVAWNWSSAGYLRNLGNTRMYPWDVDYPGWGLPEEHYTGEIWGGFLYDLYRVLGKNSVKYVAQSYYYFDPSPGFQAYQPDFWDAIYAMMLAEEDLAGGNLTMSRKAWGVMASRGINGLLQPVYSSSNYFDTKRYGEDDRWYWYYNFPSNRTISTKGNLLSNWDTHEYIINTNNYGMKLTAAVAGVKNGLYYPQIAVYDGNGNLVAGPVANYYGSSVNLTAYDLYPGVYVVKVSGQTAVAGKGYYGFKVSVQ